MNLYELDKLISTFDKDKDKEIIEFYLKKRIDLIKYINSLDACIGGWLDWFDREFFAELGASTVKLN